MAGIILGIVNIVSGGKILGQNQSVGNYSDADDNCTMDFFDDSRGLPEIIVRHTATPSTITGRAASTGMTKTMTGMMTAMTDFGTRGNFDRKVFRISDFSCFKTHRYSVIQLFS